jgi:DNA-binding response OmpR family regulator
MANKRILILDDNEAILEIVSEALRYENFDVLDISYGYQLLEATADFSPNLILLDYRLADSNGDDLCQKLKADPAYRHIPVIIFSAYFNPADSVPENCNGILYKPFDLDALLHIVHLHIEENYVKQVD